MHRLVLVAVTAISLCLESYASASAAAPPVKRTISFQTIHTDGKDILLTTQIPIPGKTVKTIYTVKVPVKTPSGIQYRDEIGVRFAPATKKERVPASRDHFFTALDGTKIPRDKVIPQIPKTGRAVISLIGNEPLPNEWNQLLRKDVILMRFNPPPFDDEQ